MWLFDTGMCVTVPSLKLTVKYMRGTSLGSVGIDADSVEVFVCFELTLDQKYQKVIGKVSGTGLSPNVTDPILEGDSLQFTLVDSAGRFVRFRGKVDGDSIEGTAQVSNAAEARWSARRAN